jgi:hypothetical protein
MFAPPFAGSPAPHALPEGAVATFAEEAAPHYFPLWDLDSASSGRLDTFLDMGWAAVQWALRTVWWQHEAVRGLPQPQAGAEGCPACMCSSSVQEMEKVGC